MKISIRACVARSALLISFIAPYATSQAAPNAPVKSSQAPSPPLTWKTVVNNNDLMPPWYTRQFNSYNQPSVNLSGLVVIRARSRGGSGEPPVHGIYTRDMSRDASLVTRILDRSSDVPQPNNLNARFVETPAFPRIDKDTSTIVTRGNHPPVWRYVTGIDPNTGEEIETRVGTTGIYTNPFGPLITAASKLGGVSAFNFFSVPGELAGTVFDVFPGAPAVTDGNRVVFKGNYTTDGIGRTGIYYRTMEDQPIGNDHLFPAGGAADTVMIANNRHTLIPGTDVLFGSTSPPSAADGKVVFAGFDNEEAPTLGGLYLAELESQPALVTLVSIGDQIPGGTANDTFNNLGEGGAFDGRFVGFWGAWGSETRTLRLYCPTEGNKDRIDYCNQELLCLDPQGQPKMIPATGMPTILGDPLSQCVQGKPCYQERTVPRNQGIFVHDTQSGRTLRLTDTDMEFDELLFWNYSGKPPCSGSGHGEEGAEDDAEPARFRSSAFVAVAGRGSGASFNTVFKARRGEFENGIYQNPVDGIYQRIWPGTGRDLFTLLDTTMSGRSIDPEAPVDALISEVGIEREGLRGRWLVINASMTTATSTATQTYGEESTEDDSENDSLAGVYLTRIR